MTKAHITSDNAKIAPAALRLAGAKGWIKISLDEVAKAAGIPVTAIKKRFSATHELAPLIAAEIDRGAFTGLGKAPDTPHDILFDLLMARFDILQKHRKAIISMGDAARRDRALACALGRATLDGVYRVIEVSQLTQPPRPVLALGLTAVYGWAFAAWRTDQSRDMARTMAALDRALRLAAKALQLVKPRS